MSDSKSSAEGAEGSSPSSDLCEAIREASAEPRLARLSALRSRFPGLEIEALLEASEAEDLKLMRGKSDLYYFSTLWMTEAYALHLFRVEEHDPLRLVAETVRDESELYPRPTDIRTFLDPPFSLTIAELDDTLGRMSLSPELSDIKFATASNGARYLYSSLHLGEAKAEALVEWIEVGQKENP